MEEKIYDIKYHFLLELLKNIKEVNYWIKINRATNLNYLARLKIEFEAFLLFTKLITHVNVNAFRENYEDFKTKDEKFIYILRVYEEILEKLRELGVFSREFKHISLEEKEKYAVEKL